MICIWLMEYTVGMYVHLSHDSCDNPGSNSLDDQSGKSGIDEKGKKKKKKLRNEKEKKKDSGGGDI